MSERFPHDAAYKAFFSDPAMVESLLRDFVPEDFIQDLDFSTLERCSGSYQTGPIRKRFRLSGRNLFSIPLPIS